MHESDGFGPFWRPSTVLMIGLVACFAVQQIIIVHMEKPYDAYLALSNYGLRNGHVWELFTYQFLHAGLGHLLGNLIGIFFFGRAIEGFLGAKKFLLVYQGAVLAGGLLQGGLGFLFPNFFGGLTYGASAGVCGVLAAFCMMEPESRILLFFFLPIKSKHLLYAVLGIAAFFTLVPSDPAIAHAAHLGGLLFGMAFIFLGFHREFGKLDKLRSLMPTRKESPGAAPRKILQADFGKSSPPTSQASSQQVDAILDKINSHGLKSLTAEERRILEAARQKMDGR